MSSKAGKRPLRSLTAHEKLEAIRRVHEGESKASVARDIGVPESTLRGWCKNEDKISYLSRQSSPDTDESSAPGVESKEKKAKLEDGGVLQPYNLSKKASSSNNGSNNNNGGQHSPNHDFDAGNKALNLNVKPEGFKTTTSMSERERNRAELARLSVELGLNRPEMFLPNMNNAGNSLSDLTGNINLLAQWNNIMMQQQQQQKQNNVVKVTAAPADTSSSSSLNGVGSFPVVGPSNARMDTESKHKPPKIENPTLDESVWYWLKTQPSSVLGLIQNQQPAVSSSSSNAPPVTSSNNYNNPEFPPEQNNSSWFWKWYKQFANSYAQQQQHTPDKPILYQQLTKDCNAENIGEEKPATIKNNTKARAVLDNLLFNNNNNNLALGQKDNVRDDITSQNEALEHGEKFLEWLECCSEPSVTTVQIMQFKYLLNNIKSGADKKNSDVQQSRLKVKRK